LSGYSAPSGTVDLHGVNVRDVVVVPFRFNGRIDKLTVKLGPDQRMPPARASMQKAITIAHD
jgi:hypothetical protein